MWDNRHFMTRQGAGFDEMSKDQRRRAFELLGAALSAKGLRKTRDIMHLNHTLAELANNFDEYGEWLYWITVMGKPHPSEPWGFQLDGHHVIVNAQHPHGAAASSAVGGRPHSSSGSAAGSKLR